MQDGRRENERLAQHNARDARGASHHDGQRADKEHADKEHAQVIGVAQLDLPTVAEVRVVELLLGDAVSRSDERARGRLDDEHDREAERDGEEQDDQHRLAQLVANVGVPVAREVVVSSDCEAADRVFGEPVLSFKQVGALGVEREGQRQVDERVHLLLRRHQREDANDEEAGGQEECKVKETEPHTRGEEKYESLC